MKYSVNEQAGIKTVVVKAPGIINTIVAEKMVMDAGKAILTSGYKKCFFDLVETEIDPEQTMTEMFIFVEIFKNSGINKSTKMAALFVTGGMHRLQLEEGAKFEGYKLKHFTDRGEAFKWLNET